MSTSLIILINSLSRCTVFNLTQEDANATIKQKLFGLIRLLFVFNLTQEDPNATIKQKPTRRSKRLRGDVSFTYDRTLGGDVGGILVRGKQPLRAASAGSAAKQFKTTPITTRRPKDKCMAHPVVMAALIAPASQSPVPAPSSSGAPLTAAPVLPYAELPPSASAAASAVVAAVAVLPPVHVFSNYTTNKKNIQHRAGSVAFVPG